MASLPSSAAGTVSSVVCVGTTGILLLRDRLDLVFFPLLSSDSGPILWIGEAWGPCDIGWSAGDGGGDIGCKCVTCDTCSRVGDKSTSAGERARTLGSGDEGFGSVGT
jgi:hypothetical protein